jgi:DNA repair protein RecN (Recombination protein N)
MLVYLTIRNLAVIEQVSVEFGPGLTVLTGETGAGKSILVEAVGLLLGGRASSDLVRTGEDAAVIEAQFDDNGRDVIVRREVSAQGRSRAFIDGTLATAGALRELSDRLIELHGQHEHQVLLDSDSHIDLLDQVAGLGLLRESTAAAFGAYQTLTAERAALQLNEREKAARIDLLTFQRGEISRAAIAPGEDEQLAARRQILANAERLQRLAGEAYAALYESENAALAGLTAVWRRVSELASLDARLTPYVEMRDGIKGQLEDLADFLRGYANDVEVSPGALQDIEDRLALLERLKRKYGPALTDVIAHGEGCARQLADLEQSDVRLAGLERAIEEAAESYLTAARALSEARRAAAAEFAARVQQGLVGLAMPNARFTVSFADPGGDGQAAWTARGFDRLEFLFSANPGEDVRPLARIASGGELSRVMLAIRTTAAGSQGAATLIFDEVDAGIGGRAADAVGRALQQLGRTAQVLCITHLPQIAAAGTEHMRVSKTVRKGRTLTSVQRLDAASRVAELARMMAGEAETPAILSSAADLLASRRGESEARTKGESESRRVKGRS